MVHCAIVFDRGGSFGQARYTLQAGSAYKFVSTDQGWDLRSVTGADNDPAGSQTADANNSGGTSALKMVSGS